MGTVWTSCSIPNLRFEFLHLLACLLLSSHQLHLVSLLLAYTLIHVQQQLQLPIIIYSLPDENRVMRERAIEKDNGKNKLNKKQTHCQILKWVNEYFLLMFRLQVSDDFILPGVLRRWSSSTLLPTASFFPFLAFFFSLLLYLVISLLTSFFIILGM